VSAGMIAHGASVKAVQRHLGHASPESTLDTDAHLFPDAEDVTLRALEAGLVGVVEIGQAARCVTAVSTPAESETDTAF
jgi:hypothetical protein